jgi:hypothetical protein
MTGEPIWVWLQWVGAQKGIKNTWKLTYGATNPRAHGFLMRGTRRNPGWFISHDALLMQTAATLPKDMNLREAQDAAKLILLSLKEST